MSVVKFIVNKQTSAPDTSAERMATGINNLARQYSIGLTINSIKKSVYKSIMQMVPDYISDPESLLALIDQKTGSPYYSPYEGADTRYPVRNLVVLQTHDETVTVFIYDVKIDYTFENTIIKTAVTKRRGTIKEFIQGKDISLTVNGNLWSDSQSGFPINELKALLNFLELEQSFKIHSVLSYSLGISDVVLEAGSLPQSAAKYVNGMPFSLRLVSDEDFELVIENTNVNTGI